MQKCTQENLSQYNKILAKNYNVQSITQGFNIEAPVAIKVNKVIQQSNDFLKKISLIPVVEVKGRLINEQITGPLGKRTDTRNQDREPQEIGHKTDLMYECCLTEFDVSTPYSVLDAWAAYPEFKKNYGTRLYNAIALDRIRIGFHGTKIATQSDIIANPLQQDVNIGWLEFLNQNNISQVLQETSNGKITIGASGDFKNLHALVADLYTMIKPEYRTGKEVAILGENLANHYLINILNTHGNTPSQQEYVSLLGQRFGNLPATTAPFFPGNGILITDLKNLQLYTQASAMRRKQEDQPNRNRIVEFISFNDAYAIGNLDAVASVNYNNIELVA